MRILVFTFLLGIGVAISCNTGKSNDSESTSAASGTSTSSVVATINNFSGEATTEELTVLINNTDLSCSSGDILSFDGQIWSCTAQLSGNKISGGTITEFQSTGITDNASSESLVVSSAGKVGVGTATPFASFEVHGNDANDSHVLVRQNSGSIATGIGVHEGANYGWVGTNSNHSFVIRTNLLPRVTVEDAGNVGIGVTSPARVLHISDAMRLEPVSGPPASPSNGDLYYDDSHALCIYVNGVWRVVEDGGSGGSCS